MNLAKKSILLFAPLFLVASLASCGEPAQPSQSDANWKDYVHDGSVQLTLDYAGRSFWTDGVEKVTLKTCIDGDTAHFNTSTGEPLKARFYGIDTPESTGKIEPWGKSASNYTKEILKEAEANGTIVVSSAQYTYGTPNPDSTGSRYVSIVWVNTTKKNAPLSELYCLNLMIVQDGFSWVKNVATMSTYEATFLAAEKQAREYKLHLFSEEEDPLFNYGGYEDASILDMKKAIIESFKDPGYDNPFNNAKVRVVGTVAGFANHILYLQNFYTVDQGGDGKTINPNTKEAGEYAGINVFTGMSAIPTKFTTKNAYIQLCGTALDSENFGFQISGATFRTVSFDENDAKVLIKADDNTEDYKLYTFEKSSTEIAAAITAKDYSFLNCSLQMTDYLEVTGGYTSDDGDITLYFDRSLGFNAYFTFNYHTEEGAVWTSHEDFIGKKVRVNGVFSYHKTTSGKYSFQINPSNSSGIEVEAEESGE